MILGRGTIKPIDTLDPTSLFHATKSTYRNFPDDWDWNFHMNNQSFPNLRKLIVGVT
jgi:hypothetical protein